MSSLTLLIGAAILAAAGEGELKQARSVLMGYEANRSAFSHGSFRFHFIQGSAASLPEARAGRFSSAFTARGFYAFDLQDARYERVFPEDDMAATTTAINESDFSCPLTCARFLKTSEATLSDILTYNPKAGRLVHSAEIFPGFERYKSAFIFPLDLGFADSDKGSLGHDLRQALDGVPSATLVSIDPHGTFEGIKVLSLLFELKNGRRAYHVDPSRGFIPVAIIGETRSGNRITRTYDDIRLFEGHGWLPMKFTYYYEGGISYQLVIDEAEVKAAPPKSVFALDFPEPIPMLDRTQSARYDSRASWSLIKLPKSPSEGMRRVDFSNAPPPAELSKEREPWSLRSVLIGVGLAVLVALGTLVAARRRRS